MTPTHANLRDGGNVRYMRVTPAEWMMGKIVAASSMAAIILLIAFITTVVIGGITVTEI